MGGELVFTDVTVVYRRFLKGIATKCVNCLKMRIRTDTQDERSIDPTEELEETLDLDSSFLSLRLCCHQCCTSF